MMMFLYILIGIYAYIIVFNFIFTGDGEYAEQDKSLPYWYKLNPIWWFRNSDDIVEKNAWYLPGKPLWWRRVRWFFRNPLENFDRYCVGFWDKQKWLWDAKRNFWPEEGKWIIIHLPWIWRKDGQWKVNTPWIAINLRIEGIGKIFQTYFGFKPFGEWGFAFRFHTIRR